MTIKIKKCTVKDAEELQTVSIETFADTFGPYNTVQDLNGYLDKAYDLNVLRQELNNPNSEFYFLKVDGQVAGYIKLNVFDAQTEKMTKNDLEIQRIYIREQFKRHGFGKMLLELGIDRAIKLAKENVWLGVWESNFAAQKFYESMGFKRFSEHKFIMGNSTQTDYLLKKKLR
ncbi:GNAT family N-acetyltransferase [Companilactobacillus crustorum]|uniref:GNAT family N-acetyltransferase n=1 Tax=Companilactobacillus crustorum TaxID=392416 RepID=UPI000957A2B9|nr:N-acetyltransferase [Companilactobacillus crustorum]APU71720.1 Spermidine/spermine N(1)-acetyltransferase [Companilactobacillus crustorum]